MARILNLEAYPLAETISDNSYLVGTDVTDNKETKNFKIEDLKTHILPAPLTPSGTFVNATVVVDADGQISSVSTGSSSGISLTTDFTSGPATLIGNTLNIPEYDTGEINTASNVGGGSELFKQKVGSDLEFRTLGANPNISITQGSDTVSIGVSGVALVGTYTDGYVPRWNATTNTLESGTIQDDGTNIAIGAAVNSERILNIDNQLLTGGDQYGIYINTNTAGGTGGELFGQKIDVNSTAGSNDIYGLEIELQANNGSPDKVKGIVIDQKTNSSASGTISGDIKGIEIGLGASATGYTVNGDIRAIDIKEIDKGSTVSGSRYGIYQQGVDDVNYLAGNVGIGTTPVASKTLAVEGNSIISGQLDLNGSGDSKLKLINYLDPTTGEKNSNYITWYKSDNTTRRGYLGFTDENTFRINVQESPDISQIILDADEIILNSTDETQSGTIKSGVWEATPIADAYIAEDYAKVGTYTDGYVPRWNSTANTLESGSITDISNQIGIGTATPDSILDIEGGNGQLEVRLDNEYTSNINQVLLTSTDGNYANIFSVGSDTANAEFQFGIIGSTATALNQVGSVDDSFILATSSVDDMNFINTEGTGTTDNIGFYVGKAVADTLASTTPDLIILGSSANKGNVGVGTATPTEKLEVTGNVKVNGQAYSDIQSASTPTTAQTIDWDDGNVAIIDLGSATGNVALTLSNPKAGASYFIKIIQGASLDGIIFPTSVKFAGETAPYTLPVTATNNAIDAVALTCISDSGTVEYLANCSKNYG